MSTTSNSSARFVEAGAKGVLSVLSQWLEDPFVSEIMINKPFEVFIEKKGEVARFEVPDLSPIALKHICTFIANESEQILNNKHPLLSASLYDGSRVQVLMPPVSPSFALSIRKSSIQKMSLRDYADNGFFSKANAFATDFPFERAVSEENETLLRLYSEKKWELFLKEAVLARKNIIVSGGTSSGKTTFLNALLREIPEDERILCLEDTKEVKIEHKNALSLLTSKGNQGLANVNMQQLLQSCLRLRPDRIIMGEIRGGEIMDFVSACSTGHEGSITSIHANNPRIAFMRMTQMYKLNNVPSMRDEDILRELDAIADVIIQLGKEQGERFMKYCYFKGANFNDHKH